MKCACKRGHLRVIETFLDRGADINASNRSGETPLHTAVWNQTDYNLADDVVKLLLAKGADVNARSRSDDTPFHAAVSSWNDQTLKPFLTNGADLWRRQYELTPVGLAIKSDNMGAVRLLVEKGAEHSAIHVAAYAGHLNELKRYLATSGDLNAQDPSRMTLLACAICGGQERVVEWLLGNGADVNRRGGLGWTPLHWACMTDQDIYLAEVDLSLAVPRVGDIRSVIKCSQPNDVTHTELSPDGRYLAFSYGPAVDYSVGIKAPGWKICVSDLTGQWVQITTDGRHNKEPDWVPLAR